MSIFMPRRSKVLVDVVPRVDELMNFDENFKNHRNPNKYRLCTVYAIKSNKIR